MCTWYIWYSSWQVRQLIRWIPPGRVPEQLLPQIFPHIPLYYPYIYIYSRCVGATNFGYLPSKATHHVPFDIRRAWLPWWSSSILRRQCGLAVVFSQPNAHIYPTPKKIAWVVVSSMFHFHRYLGRWSILTYIWNHQLVSGRTYNGIINHRRSLIIS